MRGPDLLDERGLLLAGDPDCTALLAVCPVLDPAGGAQRIRDSDDEMRATYEQPPVPEGVMISERPGVRVYRPAVRTSDRAGILFVHGGGLVAGTVGSDDVECATLALAHGCPVVSVDYRLAPEHPYPAALDDCLAALRWTVSADGPGIDPGRLLVIGISAGGGLAAALGMLARDRGLDVIGALELRYPMLDDRDGRPSMERAVHPRTWHRGINRYAWDAYLAGVAEVTACAAPGRAGVEQLRGLPPTFLDVGTLDPFFDDVIDLAHRLAQAGVAVELVTTPRAFHASDRLNPKAVTSRRTLDARACARTRFFADYQET